MKRLIYLMFFIGVMLVGCTTMQRGLEYGRQGYNTPVGQAAQTAVSTATEPITGKPYSGLLGTLAGLIAGGLAVWKRKQWLDAEPPTAKK